MCALFHLSQLLIDRLISSSSSRHATNVFADFERQTAINLFLGLLDPQSEQRPWLTESGKTVVRSTS